MPSLEELVSTAQIVVTDLNKKLLQIEEIHQDIKRLRDSSSSIPEKFNQKFQEIVDLTTNYTNTLGGVTKTYLDGNNTLFTSKINELSDKIVEIEKEISRLVNTDFQELFTALQKEFIDQTREDLEKELKRFEDKSEDLQTKINELKIQVTRIEGVDLVSHFDNLQDTLGKIFGAINAVNLTLTNIIQTLTGIVQSLGTIQTTLDTNHKEAKQLLNSFSKTTEKHLTDQDKQATKNLELLESKIKSLSEQNELLKREVKTNRIIQIVGLTIILIILIYVAAK